MTRRTSHTPNRVVRARALRASASLAATVALAALPLAAAPAYADTDDTDTASDAPLTLTESAQDGTWYFDHFGIGAIHEDGITGEGITVAVIDSPINPDVPDLRDANLKLMTSEVCGDYDGTSHGSEASHGTSMTAVIAGTNTGAAGLPGIPGVAPGATVLHYGALVDPRESGCDATLADYVQNAVDNGAKVISMSFGWPDLDDVAESVAIAHEHGAIVDIAVANESLDALDPEADFNGVVTIENMDPEGNSDGREVVSNELAVVAPGVDIRSPDLGDDESWESYRLSVGTSPATAWVSGVLALAWSKWPEATSNQMIQSLIRNTSNGWDELTRTDIEGFGLVSPHNLVVMNPQDYPDENPLLRDVSGEVPTWGDIMGDAEPTDWEFINASIERGSSVPTAFPTKQPTPWTLTGPGLGTLAGVLMLIAVAFAIPAVLMVMRRRKALAPAAAGPGAWGGAPAGPGAPGAPGGWGAPAGGAGPVFGGAAPAFGGGAPAFGSGGPGGAGAGGFGGARGGAPAFGGASTVGGGAPAYAGSAFGGGAPAHGSGAPAYGVSVAGSGASTGWTAAPGTAGATSYGWGVPTGATQGGDTGRVFGVPGGASGEPQGQPTSQAQSQQWGQAQAGPQHGAVSASPQPQPQPPAGSPAGTPGAAGPRSQPQPWGQAPAPSQPASAAPGNRPGAAGPALGETPAGWSLRPGAQSPAGTTPSSYGQQPAGTAGPSAAQQGPSNPQPGQFGAPGAWSSQPGPSAGGPGPGGSPPPWTPQSGASPQNPRPWG